MGNGREQGGNSGIKSGESLLKLFIEASQRDPALTELEVTKPNFRFRGKRKAGAPTTRVDNSTESQETDPYADIEMFPRVRAPLAGLWWPRPAPTAPTYVDIGDWVGPDTLVGLLETMKIFSEVRASDISKLHPEALNTQGVLVRVVAKEGQLVHAGDELMILDRAPKAGQPIPYGPPRI